MSKLPTPVTITTIYEINGQVNKLIDAKLKLPLVHTKLNLLFGHTVLEVTREGYLTTLVSVSRVSEIYTFENRLFISLIGNETIKVKL